MNPELTLKDIEEHTKDCMLFCEEDLVATTQEEGANIEAEMQARFARMFGNAGGIPEEH